jgi:hypothetical protein
MTVDLDQAMTERGTTSTPSNCFRKKAAFAPDIVSTSNARSRKRFRASQLVSATNKQP